MATPRVIKDSPAEKVSVDITMVWVLGMKGRGRARGHDAESACAMDGVMVDRWQLLVFATYCGGPGGAEI